MVGAGSALHGQRRPQDDLGQGMVRLEDEQILESDGFLQHVPAANTAQCHLNSVNISPEFLF